MSFNIEWTNADALTPSPFTVTKNGLSYRVELDVHYISEAEMQTLRRYIANLNDENNGLRELVEDMLDCIEIQAAWQRAPTEEMCEEFAKRARELGVDDGDDDRGSDGIRE